MPRMKRTTEDIALAKKIGDNIKYYRINNNCSVDKTDKYGRISQEKLAELADVSASMISNIEAAHVDTTMSISFLRKIAKALDIPIYAFFLEEPVKNPPKDPFAGR